MEMEASKNKGGGTYSKQTKNTLQLIEDFKILSKFNFYCQMGVYSDLVNVCVGAYNRFKSATVLQSTVIFLLFLR